MPPHPDPPAVEVTEMPPFFSNTTCTTDFECSSWEEIYKLFEEEEPKVVMRQVMMPDDTTSASKTTWVDVANSHIHRILAQPKIMPYTDLVKWLIDGVNIADRTFITPRTRTLIGSFKAKYLRNEV